MAYNQSVAERFYDKIEPVTESGCWIWMSGSKDENYGSISVNNKNMGAHRMSYILHKGEIPNGLYVLHTCDIRCCVNPDHLFLGTQQDNVDDMMMKKRNKQPRGERHGSSKLTNNEARLIINEYSEGTPQKELSNKYGISTKQISKIVTGTARTELYKQIIDARRDGMDEFEAWWEENDIFDYFETRAAWKAAINAAIKIAYDCDKSTHPSDLAEKLKEVRGE